MKKENLTKFYQNYRLYIFPISVALSCLILIIFVIYPQTVSLISNQKTKGEIINRSKFLEVKAQTLENFDTTELNQKLDSTLAAYPNSKDFVNVFGLLQNLTSKSSFTITSISLGALQKDSAVAQSYTIKIEVLGSLNLLPILLNNLESSPRLMRVSSVQTTIGKDPQGSNIALDVEVLYASAPEGFGTIDSPLPELSQKDQEVLATLAKVSTSVGPQPVTPQLGPRGKANPFE